tara:strand:- start:103 stop:312 length:210 start_codon:yes stop_codon:yes gene_type:complete
MDNLELWAFDVFLVGSMVWFYYYFYSMFNAIADLNDRLITMWNKKMEEDEVQVIEPDEGQLRLVILEEE